MAEIVAALASLHAETVEMRRRLDLLIYEGERIAADLRHYISACGELADRHYRIVERLEALAQQIAKEGE